METRKVGKVLLLGSGALKIGQAGEFDYSGSQALKALREAGVASVLINPNIATIQTSEGMADATYFLPVTAEFVTQVIEKEKPDGILLCFGGQTALNCGIELDESGVLKKYGVRVLGTPISAIRDTEDRALFVKRCAEIGAQSARSTACGDTESAARAAADIGYPVMARVAFALGGRGSGICRDEAELRERCGKAFSQTANAGHAPQVLIEEWLGGWKEIEYEVVRDAAGNVITVCNMENVDPLGIHTGDSIVVSPSQTLSDREYQMMRRLSLDLASHLGIIGECNVQFALDPASEDYRIIEVNARLSRSSALASKATGYPLAFVAARLALGATLPEIENKVTRVTQACFEPALDYITVKMPRWDLGKFKHVDLRLGSEMKSVGEVMAIGRTFEEALQKAVRMAAAGPSAPGGTGLQADDYCCGTVKNLRRALAEPTDRRIFHVYRALSEGWSVKKINKVTGIDCFFIAKMKNILTIEEELQAGTALSAPSSVHSVYRKMEKIAATSALKFPVPRPLLLRAKQAGLSDARIGELVGRPERDVRRLREELRIVPFVKQIDTLAAEFPAKTNYLYMTYHGTEHDVAPALRGVVILGSGAYRIGSSVEFDWCCVNAAATARSLGKETIMVNCNPETVSTDYDTCDRLYFEELSLERVLDIWEREKAEGLLLSFGGQTPNNLALHLAEAGVAIYGTAPKNIDRAENRHTFSALLDSLAIAQPPWKELTDYAAAADFAGKVGYPVLVRPSYVLSGAAMNVAPDAASLEKHLKSAAEVSREHPVVITKFIEAAREIELDAAAKDGEILYECISEHIENAGVHSGDATVVLPAQHLYIETIRMVREISLRIARALAITGPFNIQFLAKHGKVSVIECNLRASRSFPFASKVSRVNLIEIATRAMLGAPTPTHFRSALDLPWVGVKAAQFSFARLGGADPVSGVEMASTGEVGCIGSNIHDAFLKAFLSVGYRLKLFDDDERKRRVLLSTGPLLDKLGFLESARRLVEMGFILCASRGTASFLTDNGIPARAYAWPLENAEPNIGTLIKESGVGLIINIPKNNQSRELKNDYLIRRMAVDYDIPLFTNVKTAREYIDAAYHLFTTRGTLEIKPWEAYQ